MAFLLKLLWINWVSLVRLRNKMLPLPEEAPDLIGHLLSGSRHGQYNPLHIMACAHRAG